VTIVRHVRPDYNGTSTLRRDDTTVVSVASITGAATLREHSSIYYDPEDPNLGTYPERLYKFYVTSRTATPTSRVWVGFSADGVTFSGWTQCVMGTSDWNSEDPDLCTVWSSPGRAHRDGSGKLHLYVEHKHGSTVDDGKTIYVYEGTDGINWTQMSGNPVIATGSGWEATLVGSPNARHDGSNYIVGYEGISATPREAFGIAYGSAPNSLTKLAGNPVWDPDVDAGVDDSIVVDSFDLSADGSAIVFHAHSGINGASTRTFRGISSETDPLALTSGDITFLSNVATYRNDLTRDYHDGWSLLVGAADGLSIVRRSLTALSSTPITYTNPRRVSIAKVKSGGSFVSRWAKVKSGGAFPTYASLVAADGAYAHWKLDESSGTTADDAIGSNDGTYVNAPTLAASGRVGSAVTFNGTDEYVSVGTLGSFGSAMSQFTVECWIKTTTSAQDAVCGFLNTGSTMMLQVTLNTNGAGASSAGKTLFSFRGANGRTCAVDISASIYDGAWHHLVGVGMMPASGTSAWEVYVDGEPVAVTYASQQSDFTFASLGYALTIAARNVRGSIDQFAAATIDEFAVYTRALTAAEVADHYAAGIST